MRVRYTSPAIIRFADVLTSLRALNPLAAVRLGQDLARSLRRIATFPRSGFPVAEFPGRPLREVIVEPYRFFYFIDEKKQTVWIVAIWHVSQIPSEPQLPAS